MYVRTRFFKLGFFAGWCCLLAKEVAHTFPACKAFRCETMENDLSAASLVTFSSTVAPLLVDPEVKEYMTDANARKSFLNRTTDL